MTRAHPELFARYGPIGKERCLEDTAFHVRHLAAALDAGDPEEFVAYRRWLVDLLVPRGVPETDITSNFAALAEVLRQRYGSDADVAVSLLNASSLG